MFDRIKYFTFGLNPIGIRRIESKWSVKHTMQRLITIGYWNGFDRDDQCIYESSDEFVCTLNRSFNRVGLLSISDST